MGKGNHAVRSMKWRYIRYMDGTEKLYDGENDPWEWKNLAHDQAYSGVIEELKKHMPP
ncbi:hypothetical protein [Aquiflexum sp.]|uniref:hypothetical protein n=1 Tax=Aquiflexum sp. TaxID=1872584 RepID=UPI0035944EB1